MPISYALNEEFYGQYPGTREVEAVPLLLCIVKKPLLEKLPIPECAGTAFQRRRILPQSKRAGL